MFKRPLIHPTTTTKTRIVISVSVIIAGLTKSASVPGHPEIALRRRPEQVVRNAGSCCGGRSVFRVLIIFGVILRYCSVPSMDPWRYWKGRKISMYILWFSIRSGPFLEVCA